MYSLFVVAALTVAVFLHKLRRLYRRRKSPALIGPRAPRFYPGYINGTQNA